MLRDVSDKERSMSATAEATAIRPSPCRSASPPFPVRSGASPPSWVEAVYPGLAYFNEVGRGGDFAAGEEPALFSAGVRAAFRSLR